MSSLLAASNPTVTLIGVVLVLIGLFLFVTTIRLWRAASVDPEVLAPLEMMATRRFSKADDDTRTRILDDVRHPGAVKIERILLEPEPARQKRRHRRHLEKLEAEQQSQHFDTHVMRTDDSREIDLRASDQPSPEPMPWDEPQMSSRPGRGRRREARDRSVDVHRAQVNETEASWIDDDHWERNEHDRANASSSATGIDPLIGGHAESGRRGRKDRDAQEDPSSWGEYE